MARFLRDQRIKNVTIDEARLQAISDLLRDRAVAANAGEQEPRILHAVFIIRFDNKGYKVFDIADVLRFYKSAKKVERVICTLESAESLNSNRARGTHAEVALDSGNENACVAVVTSDSDEFVEATFGSMSELLTSFRNKHRLVRNPWTALVLQIAGVAVGFVLCLWGAGQIAAKLSIENPFAISFLFLLLIFFNIWGFLNQALLRFLGSTFPNVFFARDGREPWHWLKRTVVGAIVVAVVLFLLGQLSEYAGVVLRGILK